MRPSELARLFHETYEELAPRFGYATRPESRVAWDDVPENNKRLMIATCREVLLHIWAEDPLAQITLGPDRNDGPLRHVEHLGDGMDHRYCDACRSELNDGSGCV